MRTASKCGWCSQVFEHKRTQVRRCCSRTCAAKLRNQEQAAAGTRFLPTKPRRGDVVPCVTCGKTFYRQPAMIEQQRQFCSIPCARAVQAKEPVVKQCVTCGTELRLKPSQARIQYCTKECEAAGRTKRPLDRTHNGKRARKDRAGYVLVWEPLHPNKSFHGWQYEHRLLVEGFLGRYLASGEHVHHLNGVKDDNRLENLQVLSQNEHAALSGIEYRQKLIKDRAELAEYKRRYGPLTEE